MFSNLIYLFISDLFIYSKYHQKKLPTTSEPMKYFKFTFKTVNQYFMRRRSCFILTIFLSENRLLTIVTKNNNF